jgi:iron complex transport system substrate-binding protein
MSPAAVTSRRTFLTLLGAAGLAAGCGAPTATAPAAPATRTVTHRFGTFEVPTDPQRVVGIEGRRDLETALALGLRPVGIGSNALYGGDTPAPWLDLPLDGVTVIQQTEPGLEQIAALRPDLVLTRDSNIEELRDELVALAPVLPVGSGTDPDNTGDDWRADLEQVAGWLGREDRLAATLAAYDAQRDEIAARHADPITSAVVAVVQYSAEGGTLETSRTDGFYLQAQALGALGGRHLPYLEELPRTDYIASFSTEQMGELAPADAILMIANTADDRAALDAQPLWQRLPAVAAGRVVLTDSRANYGSVYAAGEGLRLLDELYATLA